MEPASEWINLPAHNLQQIFQYCEIFDVKKCFLLCKHWCNEANYFLKAKVLFVANQVKNVEDIQLSQRRFEKVYMNFVDGRENIVMDVFAALKQRKHTGIKKATIVNDDYTALSNVLKLLGNNLTFLVLENKMAKAKSNSACPSFGDLSSVEDLTIEGFDNLNVISRQFSNLRSLKLIPYYYYPNGTVLQSIVQDFMVTNPFLKSLDLNMGAREDMVSLLSPFKNWRILKQLKLSYIYFNKDFEGIANHLNSLEALEIGRMSSDVQPRFVKLIFQMPSLKKITLNGRYETTFWEELFSITSTNYNIENLALNNNVIEGKDLISMIKLFPNISFFSCQSVKTYSFELFQEMAANWEQLESLSIKFHRFSPQPQRSEHPTIEFQKLTYLKLSSLPSNFYDLFLHLKAVNLKYLHLEYMDCNGKPQLLCPNLNIFGTNCPNIYRFDLIPYNNNEINAVKYFPLCFKNLKTFYVNVKFFSQQKNLIKIFVGYMRKNIRILVESTISRDDCSGIVDRIRKDGGVVEFKGNYIKRILYKEKEILFNFDLD